MDVLNCKMMLCHFSAFQMPNCFSASWIQLSGTCKLDKEGPVNIHSGSPHIDLDGYYRKVCYGKTLDLDGDIGGLRMAASDSVC